MGLKPLRRVLEIDIDPCVGGLVAEVKEFVAIGETVFPRRERIVERFRFDFDLEAVRVLVCLDSEEACCEVDPVIQQVKNTPFRGR